MQSNSPTRTKRLTNQLEQMGIGELADEYFAIAYNIEDALIYAGAIAGKDYTYLDLFKLAQPFVLEKFKAGAAEFTYPTKRLAK